MRLWRKYLIDVLPRKQLAGQWRECCLIAKNISENGTPNHLLVNKIIEYPYSHFYSYTLYVFSEMLRREYKCNWNAFRKYLDDGIGYTNLLKEDLFSNWHDEEYLTICYYNLREKYLCGGISEEEWKRIENFYKNKEIIYD